MKLLWELFVTFFKIGAFTFGGGQAMIPIIQHEVCTRKKWVGEEDIVDILVLAQSVPGVIAVNAATLVGYKLRGMKGAFFATLGVIVPSFAIILSLANLLLQYSDSEVLANMFAGIRAVVVALMTVAVYKMGKACINDRTNLLIAIIALLIVLVFDIHPIAIIIGGALVGIIMQNKLEKACSSTGGKGQ